MKTKMDFDTFITEKYYFMPEAEIEAEDYTSTLIVWGIVLMLLMICCYKCRQNYKRRVQIRAAEAELAAEQEAELNERNKLKRMNQELKRFELDIK